MVETLTRKGAAQRTAIIGQARAALLSRGYAEMSLREIAKALGMSLGNLQYYFATKDALVEAAIQDEVDQSLDLFDAIDWDAEQTEETIRAAVAMLVDRLSGVAGQLYLVSGFLALHDPRFQRLQSAGYDQFFGSIGAVVTRLAPHLPPAARRRLTRMIVALFDGVILQIHGQVRPPSRAEIAALTDSVAAAITCLLTAKPFFEGGR